jgi:hypothetical protein
MSPIKGNGDTKRVMFGRANLLKGKGGSLFKKAVVG